MKKAFDSIVSTWIWITGALLLFIFTLLLLFIGIFHTGCVFEWVLKLFCKLFVFITGMRVKVSGLETLDHTKQYIIMMNHVNMFDAFLYYSRFPGKARGLEEESHFNWPVYGWAIRRVGHIPINRKSPRKAIEALKKAAELIREKKDFSFVVMPEGTRSINKKLGNFKKGGFLLALEAGLDILPIVQLGSFKIKHKKSWLIRPGKVQLVVEKPISIDGYDKDNVRELMQKTRELFLKYVD
ncbi:MAG: 1-acyl-sn-glycerol-3-phosphate acyltransferase [bacterium]|nr:1-acyl-sn-glycerol-3-phosphate acyltransferase [bacterium]